MNHAKDTEVDAMGDYAPTFNPQHATIVSNRDEDGKLIPGTPVLVQHDGINDPSRIVSHLRDSRVTPDGLEVALAGKLELRDCNVYIVEGPNGQRLPNLVVLSEESGSLSDGTPILSNGGMIPQDMFASTLLQRVLAELAGEEEV